MSESTKARQVLVVDDEPEVQAMFRQRMRREVRSGTYELFFAESGFAALEVLRENPGIQLVLTDLNMPGLGGMGLLAELGESWPAVLSIVVSAYGDPDRVAEAHSRGAKAFIVKPVDFPELKELMRQSLGE